MPELDEAGRWTKLGTAFPSLADVRLTREAAALVKRPRSWPPGAEIEPPGCFRLDNPSVAQIWDDGRTEPNRRLADDPSDGYVRQRADRVIAIRHLFGSDSRVRRSFRVGSPAGKLARALRDENEVLVRSRGSDKGEIRQLVAGGD